MRIDPRFVSNALVTSRLRLAQRAVGGISYTTARRINGNKDLREIPTPSDSHAFGVTPRPRDGLETSSRTIPPAAPRVAGGRSCVVVVCPNSPRGEPMRLTPSKRAG